MGRTSPREKSRKKTPAVVDAIIEEARKYNIPVTVHIATLADTEFLVKSGAAGFLHMIRDTEDLDPAFLAKLSALKLPFAPTLVRQELAGLYEQHPQLVADPGCATAIEPQA